MHTILITTSTFGKNNVTPLRFGLRLVPNALSHKLIEDEMLNLIHQHKPIGLLAEVEPLVAKVLSRAKNLILLQQKGEL